MVCVSSEFVITSMFGIPQIGINLINFVHIKTCTTDVKQNFNHSKH